MDVVLSCLHQVQLLLPILPLLLQQHRQCALVYTFIWIMKAQQSCISCKQTISNYVPKTERDRARVLSCGNEGVNYRTCMC